MSAAIWKNRFIGYKEPGWHNLGTVIQELMNAQQAYQLMGAYDLEEVPVPPIRRGKVKMPVPFKTIVRKPTKDSPEPEVFTVVSNEYVLVRPKDMVAMWDRAVKLPVETIFALRGGRVLGISAVLPSFDVKGEEINNYLVFSNGMDRSWAMRGNVTPVRPVCQNTLVAGVAAALTRISLPHRGDPKSVMEKWLSEMVADAKAKTQALQEAFNILAAAPVKRTQAQAITKVVFADLPRPVSKPSDPKREQKEASWLQAMQEIQGHRTVVLNLFEGAGTGMNTPAAQGTAWGLYNSFVEYLDYNREGKESRADASYSAVFGTRAQLKELAFTESLALARN